MGIASKWVQIPCSSVLLETWTCISCQCIEFSNSCLLYVLLSMYHKMLPCGTGVNSRSAQKSAHCANQSVPRLHQRIIEVKPMTMNDLLFVRSNQDLVQAGITLFFNTWAQFEQHGWTWMSTCHAMGGHGWAQVDADGYGLGMDTNSNENVGLWCEVALTTPCDPAFRCFCSCVSETT